jgi:hypothetical protein
VDIEDGQVKFLWRGEAVSLRFNQTLDPNESCLD